MTTRIVLSSFLALIVALDASAMLSAQTYRGRSKPADGSAFAQAPGPFRVRMERDVMVPMRDGVRLANDVYIPVAAADRNASFPVIYSAGPYGKAGYDQSARFFASHGFVFVAQDTRGKFGSEGRHEVEHNYGRDGFDTIAWLARQPWSSGRIGMIGCSASGNATYYTVRQRPPALKAVIAGAAGSLGGTVRPDGNTGGRYGGVEGLVDGFNWMRETMETSRLVPDRPVAGDALTRLTDSYGKLQQKPPPYDESLLRTLPVATMMERSGSLPNDWVKYRGSGLADPWFATFDRPTEQTAVDTPTLHMVSWPDYAAVTGTIYFWRLFRQTATSERVRSSQYLFLSADEHCGWDEQRDASQMLGDRAIGDQRFDIPGLYLDWFSHWLRDDRKAAASIESMAPVQYYTTGSNAWRSAASWPPAGTRPVTLRLGTDTSAVGVFGGGRLFADELRASGTRATDRIVSDPNNPVLTFLTGAKSGSWGGVASSADQAARDARSDVLVYETAPLTADMTVSGSIRLDLKIALGAPDADIHAWISEVDEQGRAWPIQEGAMRMSFISGYDAPRMIAPGKTYDVALAIRDVSHRFAKGRRLRLSLAGSNFPRYIRNAQTGAASFFATELRPTTITIGYGTAGSSITLPVEDAR